MQAGQFGAHRVGDLQGVGGWRRIDTEIGGVFAVQLRAGTVAARPQFNGGHFGESNQLTVFPAADRYLAEAFRIAQAADAVDGQRLLLTVEHRRRAYLPRRPLHILLPQRLGNIVGRHIQRVHAIGAQPDAHAVITGAEHLHFADAR